jgi:magnesium-transporting ATPase (P-type)
VNFSALVVEFLGYAIVGEGPLSTVQLLWVNLIMDTFAAIALASETPQPSIIRTPPTRNDDLIMTKHVWRQIYGMSLWNILVITFLVLFGKYIMGFEFERNQEFYDGTTPTSKCILYTMIFETFIFLQLFNEFNCRNISPNKYNMFGNLISSWLFLLVVAATFVLTVLFV